MVQVRSGVACPREGCTEGSIKGGADVPVLQGRSVSNPARVPMRAHRGCVLPLQAEKVLTWLEQNTKVHVR